MLKFISSEDENTRFIVEVLENLEESKRTCPSIQVQTRIH